MKLIYSHPNFAQVGVVRSLIENAGIPCITRNEHLSPLAGGLPALDVWPQLWVAEEDGFLAQSVISGFDQASASLGQEWMCPRCGATNEGNMGLCWNCDWEVDGPNTQEDEPKTAA